VAKSSLQILIDYYENIEPDEIFYLLDKNFTFLYVSQKFSNLLGVSNDIMKSKKGLEIDNQLVRKMANSLQFFNSLIKNKKLTSIYGVYALDTVFGKKIYEYNIKYLSAIDGYKIQIHELQLHLVGDVINFINQISAKSKVNVKTLVKENNLIFRPKSNNLFMSVEITEQEHEILFLLMIGKSYKEIALILSKVYSDKTITYLKIQKTIHEKLLDKFNCLSVQELINSYLMNYSTHVTPERLFSNDYFGVLSFFGFSG